jgi:exonuclease VII large subunit
MGDLAAAQERTDQHVDQLAGRMDQLTGRMDDLAKSQQSMQQTFERFMVRTEEQFTSVRQELRETTGALEKKMDASFADVRKQLGGLSLSVGMGLEAYALDKIPRLLEMHCGFKTESVFPETFTDGGRTEDIDVVVRGSIAGEPAVVVCEVKTNITQTEVRDFFARVDRVRSRLGCDDVRVLFFGYRAAPETHGMIEDAGGWLALPAGILRINRQAG